MKVLDFNNRLILATLEDKTILLKSPSLELISQCKGSYPIGSLQYETGIAALGAQSLVSFYDFKYERKIEQVDTVLKLIDIKILKNLVFCVSVNRILIYDIATKNNICNISTSDGSLMTYNSNYYNLRLLYPISPNIYHEQQIWANMTKKIQCSPCSIIKYDRTGQILCLAQDNVIALYEKQQIIRGCSFQDKITHILPSLTTPHRFYIRTQKKEMQNIEQGKSQKKILYIDISVTNKFYLKLTEQQVSQNGKKILNLMSQDAQILFQHQNTLYICKNNKIYKAEIDLQPNLKGMNIEQWQKLKQQSIMINSQRIQNEQQEVPRSEQVQKQLQMQEKQKQEQKKQEKQTNIIIQGSSFVESRISIEIKQQKIN